jgi:hypothetical protein
MKTAKTINQELQAEVLRLQDVCASQREAFNAECKKHVEKYERLVKNDTEMLDSVTKTHKDEMKRRDADLVARTQERDALAWWVCQNHLKVLDPKG